MGLAPSPVTLTTLLSGHRWLAREPRPMDHCSRAARQALPTAWRSFFIAWSSNPLPTSRAIPPSPTSTGATMATPCERRSRSFRTRIGGGGDGGHYPVDNDTAAKVHQRRHGIYLLQERLRSQTSFLPITIWTAITSVFSVTLTPNPWQTMPMHKDALQIDELRYLSTADVLSF